MNMTLLLIISISVCYLSGLLRSLFTKKMARSTADLSYYNCISAFFSIVVFLFCARGNLHISPFTWIMGTLFGVVCFTSGIFGMLAVTVGPVSYTSVITSFSMLIPALSGALFWNEKITASQFLGIGLTLAALILSVDNRRTGRKASLRWLIFCLITFFSGGIIGVLQKIHQSSNVREELNQFLIVAFAVNSLLSVPVAVRLRKQEKTKFRPFDRSTLLLILLFALAGGVCAAFNNNINLYLSGVMPSAVFFPTVNGANVILSILGGLVIFREKPSAKQWCGMIAGVIAVFFLCGIF